MVPLEAVSIGTKSVKVLWLKGTRAACLILVALLVVESVEVVGASKFGIEEYLTKDALIEFCRIELFSNLIRRDTCKRCKYTWEETTEPNRRSFQYLRIV